MINYLPLIILHGLSKYLWWKSMVAYVLKISFSWKSLLKSSALPHKLKKCLLWKLHLSDMFLIQINEPIHIKYSVQFDQVFANYLNICTYTDIEKKLNWPHLVFCPNTPNIKHGSFYKKENETFFSTLLIDLFCNSKKDERHESSLILVHSALCVFAQI